MTDTDKKPKRSHNKEWQDTTRTTRSHARRTMLRQILAAAGWSGESELHTAIINGEVTVPQNPNKS